MFAHIEGRVEEKRQGELVLDVNGIGFLLRCPASTVAAAPAAGQNMRCYTHFSVREDAMELFGFATKEEKDMFKKLLSVNKIGPKTALDILSTFSIRELSLALVTGDVNAIARAPGVGKKTAQMLVLQLKDSVEQADMDVKTAAVPALSADAQEEAIQALLALGYSSAEARGAVAKVQDQSDQAEMLILLALKRLGG